MGRTIYRASLIAIGIAAIMPQKQALAAVKIEFGDNQFVSVGMGIRGAFRSTENADNNGDRSNDFSLDSARLYIAGAVNDKISGIFTTEKSGGNDTMQVIDAAGIFKLTPDIEIWAGRFLSPGSRANLAGPYYSLGGDYWQNIAARYGWNGGTIGRDDGVAVVAKAFDQRLVYSFGAFDADKIFHFSGVNDVADNPEQSDALMYASRLQYSFGIKSRAIMAPVIIWVTRIFLLLGSPIGKKAMARPITPPPILPRYSIASPNGRRTKSCTSPTVASNCISNNFSKSFADGKSMRRCAWSTYGLAPSSAPMASPSKLAAGKWCAWPICSTKRKNAPTP